MTIKNNKPKLTVKQELFCKEYLKDFNATRAAKEAGYSENSATEIGSENLSKPNIQEYLNKHIEARKEKLDIDADYVLNGAVEIHKRCVQEIKPLKNKKGKQIYDEDGNALFTYDAKAALGALKLIGDHDKVGCFKTRVEHDVTDNLVSKLLEGRKRLNDNNEDNKKD